MEHECNEVTLEKLREKVYIGEDGQLRFKNGPRKDKVVGWKYGKHKVFLLNHRLCYVARATYVLTHGLCCDKDLVVVPKDKNFSNTRPENLVRLDKKLNNPRNLQANNKSGFTMVRWDPRIEKYQVHIKIDGKLYSLGLYKDALNGALARYSVELQCDRWQAQSSPIYEQIKTAWPEFRGEDPSIKL